MVIRSAAQTRFIIVGQRTAGVKVASPRDGWSGNWNECRIRLEGTVVAHLNGELVCTGKHEAPLLEGVIWGCSATPRLCNTVASVSSRSNSQGNIPFCNLA